MHLIPAERCVGPLPSLRINLAFRGTASLRGVALLNCITVTGLEALRALIPKGR
jgi:hypothetical protein